MKPDLKEVKITDQELEDLTGLRHLRDDFEHIVQLYLLYEKSTDVFMTFPTEQIVIRPSTLENPEFQSSFFHVISQKKLVEKGWIGKGVNKLTKAVQKKIKKYLKTLKPTPLGILVDEVDQYNRIIDEIAFIDQLEEAGNPVSIRDRQNIIGTLHRIRAELLRAIKTERLFRENPQFKREEVSLELFSWQRLELDEKAQQYEQFVNQALDIGVKVWEDMKRWYFVEKHQE